MLRLEHYDKKFNLDPDEEFEVEEVCGKKRMDGDLYYFVKWKGYPEYVLTNYDINDLLSF